MSDPTPTDEFSKSGSLESCLQQINSAIEGEILAAVGTPTFPVLFVHGCPRSGTTLLMQWLAESGQFGYPSNLIARFFGNPAFGALVQKALVDFDKEGQMGLADQKLPQESRLGRAPGALAPSEYWYFWRRFFEFEGEHKLSPEAIRTSDGAGFVRELAGLENVLGKPLTMKGIMLNWDVPYLKSLCDKFLFLILKRDRVETALSILRSRQSYAGDRRSWWSFRPPGSVAWDDWSPEEQVAAQVMTNQSILEQAAGELGEKKMVRVGYEDFCGDPAAFAKQLVDRYDSLGVQLDLSGFRTEPYEVRAGDTAADEVEKMREAFETVKARLGA